MLLLVDLDGVVYRGPEPVPGITALLAERALAGDTVAYCTNNSTRHRDEYVDRLREMGAPVSLELIFTSARATALAIAQGPLPARVAMVVGAPGLAREVRDVGVRAVPPTRRGLAARPDAVVVGLDQGLTYRRLAVASKAIRDGARFVATNRDPVYPTADDFVPGAGSVVAALEAAGRRPPDLEIGKPKPALYEAAARATGHGPADSVVIGDSLVTDIPAANAFGARSVLMLTGVTGRSEIDAAPPELHPTEIVADAAGLRAALDRLASETPAPR